MEEFKSLDEVTKLDERHVLRAQITGRMLGLEGLHGFLARLEPSSRVPESIAGQFNVCRNMALYSYFCFSLAPEVHLKSFRVIEHALKERLRPEKRMSLSRLVAEAVEEGLIQDAGFQHVPDDPENSYAKKLPKLITSQRNSLAHGSTMLDGDCAMHVQICYDFLEQLFAHGQESEA